jgi:hypothetical protein
MLMSALLLLQIEVESGSELTEDFLLTELHPPKVAARPKFAKPAPPASRASATRRPNKQAV